MSGWRSRLRPGLETLTPYRVERDPRLVLLDANESPFAPPEPLREALAALARNATLNRYPEPSGRRLREVIAARHQVDPEQVILGNGSDEVLGHLLTAFGGPNPGGGPPRVAYPTPTFSMYGIHARCIGTEVVEIPTGRRFELDPDDVRSALGRHRPNLVFFARPNNPTGTLWPRTVVEAALERRDTLVVSDEAYGDFAGESCLELLPRNEHLVVMRTLSKVGFAALRVGWAIASPAVARELDKVRLPYNVNALSQAAAVEVLERWDELVAPAVRRIVAERERLAAALAEQGWLVFPSRANLLLLRVADADGIFDALRSRGILIRNLHQPEGPLEGCLRITVGTPAENDRLLEAMQEVLP